jgi:pimeloyl-ACP methyl ester carboxylesterase
MIPGGPTDAGIFAGLAACLADRYTVAPYDPRGNSRSVLDGPSEDQRMDVHGDDAAQLLAALGSAPAYVLGSSGGAQIGLNLAARYPERVHTLVAHEPPCLELLPDAAEQRAFMQDVYDTYRTQGIGPAMRRFEVGAGVGGGARNEAAPPPPEMREGLGRIMGNLDFFLAHGLRPIGGYIPDVAALRAGPARVVVGAGENTTGRLPHRAAAALAERLGTTLATFPGDHGGYAGQPAAFGERLHEVLRR